MSDVSKPDEIDALVRDAVNQLPDELRPEAAEWIRRARDASAAEVERWLVADSRKAFERFQAASAAVERMIAR